MKKIRIPLLVIEVYLLFTVVLYIYGPWQWKDNNMALTVIILLIFQLALLLGYIYSEKNVAKNIKKNKKIIQFRIKTIYILIMIAFIITLLQCLRTIGTISLSSILDSVSNGFFNPAEQYRSSKQVTAKLGGGIVTYIIVLLAPISWMAMPLSLIHFKKLSLFMKGISLFNILLESFRWIAIGTNKGTIDVILIIASVFFLKILQGNLNSKEKALKIKKGRTIFFITIITIFGLYIFSNNIGARINENWSNFEISNGNTMINHDSLLMKMCPLILQPTLIFVTAYLSQGYYALSLCRSLEWIPMFGCGNSMFIMENVKDIFNINLFELTYQTQMEIFSWDPLRNWHSFYVWIANDVSLLGVPIILFFIGYIFCKLVRDAVFYKDDLAMTLFCLFMIMFTYFPANNQVLSYPTTFMSFWILLFLWIITRKYKIVFGGIKSI